MSARLSLFVPTVGNPLLRRCLDSVRDQLRPGDEMLIIGDVHDGPLLETERIVADFGEPARYLTFDAGHHCWGHCQINHALGLARGDYVLGNDDDDVWTEGALDRIRAKLAERETPAPHLFRFRTHWGELIWEHAGRVIEHRLGGHCAVVPNDERLGRFTCRYQGDFDYIRSTLDNWGGDDQAVWVDEIIAVARPKALVPA